MLYYGYMPNFAYVYLLPLRQGTDGNHNTT